MEERAREIEHLGPRRIGLSVPEKRRHPAAVDEDSAALQEPPAGPEPAPADDAEEGGRPGAGNILSTHRTSPKRPALPQPPNPKDSRGPKISPPAGSFIVAPYMRLLPLSLPSSSTTTPIWSGGFSTPRWPAFVQRISTFLRTENCKAPCFTS